MKKEIEELITLARAQGWGAYQTSKGHWALLAPDEENIVILAGTPSDGRSMENAKSRLKRLGFSFSKEEIKESIEAQYTGRVAWEEPGNQSLEALSREELKSVIQEVATEAGYLLKEDQLDRVRDSVYKWGLASTTCYCGKKFNTSYLLHHHIVIVTSKEGDLRRHYPVSTTVARELQEQRDKEAQLLLAYEAELYGESRPDDSEDDPIRTSKNVIKAALSGITEVRAGVVKARLSAHEQMEILDKLMGELDNRETVLNDLLGELNE